MLCVVANVVGPMLSFLSETAPGVMGACRTFCAWLEKEPIVRSEAAPRVGYREFLLGNA